LVLLFAALRVITTRNPVHAALWLVLCFFTAAGVWMLLKAEFLAIALVLVYVGAVAVLFLFVVMMLDIDFVALRRGFMEYLPLGALIGLVLMSELLIVLGAWVAGSSVPAARVIPTGLSNTRALGQILYTDYIFYFQTAGLILLVAMIGAIVLTLRRRPGVKRQSISRQVGRQPADAMELHDVKPGQGSRS
jgi:NADH-quinone oxidoreductase subunit J